MLPFFCSGRDWDQSKIRCFVFWRSTSWEDTCRAYATWKRAQQCFWGVFGQLHGNLNYNHPQMSSWPTSSLPCHFTKRLPTPAAHFASAQSLRCSPASEANTGDCAQRGYGCFWVKSWSSLDIRFHPWGMEINEEWISTKNFQITICSPSQFDEKIAISKDGIAAAARVNAERSTLEVERGLLLGLTWVFSSSVGWLGWEDQF